MKTAKLTFLCCCISGIILFFTGIFSLVNFSVAAPQGNGQNISNTPQGSNSSKNDNNYITSGDPLNFLFLIKEASGAHTDSIIVVNYFPDTKQISMLTIPRDIKASNTSNLKVNNAYAIGLKKYEKSDLTLSEKKHKAAEYASQYISNLLGINLDYYAYLEIDTIKAIIDKLDGVYFDVPADLKYIDPSQDLYINLKKGYQLLDGDKAEQLLRFRKPQYPLSQASADLRKYYDGSDLKRTEMQIRFVNEFIKQKVTLFNFTKFIPIINYTFENVITNISLSDTLNLLGGFTQASRPETKTFKLYCVDKEINSEDFLVYIDKIEDTKTRDVYNADQILGEYFISRTGAIMPNKKYDYRPILNSNPSNAETDTSGDGQDKP